MVIHSNHFINHILFSNKRNNKGDFSLHPRSINQFNIGREVLKMDTSLFSGDMTEEMKERISLFNKKKLKELLEEGLYDILFIYKNNEIRSFYERAYRYNENEIKYLMESYYICDIYTHYRSDRDILIILEKKNNI